jgi:N-acetylglutamate synthase-like GNAT family acetyltransferase
VIHEAHRVGTHQLYLLTAARCEAAVHLFEAHGFVHSTEVMQRYGKRYARCDVAMVHRG